MEVTVTASRRRLIQMALEGDPSAGPILVSLYGPQLAAYLARVAPDTSDVDRELIAEQAIESAIVNIDKYGRELGSFDAWLRGFARRKLMEARRTRLAASDEWDDLDAPAPMPVVAQADPAPVDEDALADVAGALATLSPTDQLIIVLRDVNGLSYSEIGSALQRSSTACRQRHRRAMDNLRRAIEDRAVAVRLSSGDVETTEEIAKRPEHSLKTDLEQ
jgi:RNA polymerase sigma-70 factor (ECF subfamily)